MIAINTSETRAAFFYLSYVNVNIGHPAQVTSDNIAGNIPLKSKSIVSFRYMEVKCGPTVNRVILHHKYV